METLELKTCGEYVYLRPRGGEDWNGTMLKKDIIFEREKPIDNEHYSVYVKAMKLIKEPDSLEFIPSVSRFFSENDYGEVYLAGMVVTRIEKMMKKPVGEPTYFTSSNSSWTITTTDSSGDWVSYPYDRSSTS